MPIFSKAAGAVDVSMSKVSPEPGQESGTASAGAASKLVSMAGAAGDMALGVAKMQGGAAGGAASVVASAAASAAAGAAGQAAAIAKDVASEPTRKAADMMRHARELVEDFVKKMIQRQTERVIDRLPGLAKDALDDEDMPRWVSKGKDRLIDGMWPDARAEILWEVAVFLDRDKEKEEADIKGCDCFRAFFRYHMFPYDKSFWAQAHDPWYILFSIIPLFPVFGVNVAWFFFVFVIIDKSDAFQLVQFILSFKGMAFLSQGIIKAIVGFGMYMSCVTARANESEHDCENTGPGSSGDIWPTTVAFLIQLVLVWIAFLCLRCSKEKGRSSLKGTIEHQDEGHSSVKGGYIVYLLWYDLFAFVICLGIVGFAVSTRPDYNIDDWPVHHAVFGSQVLYGMLSMPFFLFTLPVLQRLLTHSLPTAYDRNGACRKPVRPAKKKKAQADNVKEREPGVSEAEVDDLFAKIKKAMPGGNLVP